MSGISDMKFSARSANLPRRLVSQCAPLRTRSLATPLALAAFMAEVQRVVGADGAPTLPRRLPVGAEVIPAGGVHFRVWAPIAARVEVVLEGGPGAPDRIALTPESDGYFAGEVADAAAGTLYRYRLDGGRRCCPIRRRASSPTGRTGRPAWSIPAVFAWTDDAWRGAALAGQVLYELHVGTFTPEGTWAAAARELPALAALGVTTLEVMPVAEFPGRFGWGYDGVDLFAPTRLYGEPDDFRRFVDRGARARARRDPRRRLQPPRARRQLPARVLARRTSPTATATSGARRSTSTAPTPGRCASSSSPTPATGSTSSTSTACASTRRRRSSTPRPSTSWRRSARRARAGGRPAHDRAGRRERAAGRRAWCGRPLERRLRPRRALERRLPPQRARRAHRPPRGLLHATTAARRRSSSRRRSGASSIRGSGTPGSSSGAARRPSASSRRASSPISQNHDQVANSAVRRAPARADVARAAARADGAAAARPGTPMLFQGQEFAASGPFLYFADHAGELAPAVREGRAEFLCAVPELSRAGPRDAAAPIPAIARRSSAASSIRASARGTPPRWRCTAICWRCAATIRCSAPARRASTARVLADDALVLRFFGGGGTATGCWSSTSAADRDADDRARAAAGAARRTCAGQLVWSSEDPRYGGAGVLAPETDDGWRLPAEAARAAGAGRPVSRRDRRCCAASPTRRADGTDVARLAGRRVARHQRARRLRLRHRRRRAHAALSRPARRGAAGAARAAR